ncbi:MAG: hypothetical protein NZ908_02780, partial [Candidatus Micrarchaeota archaeon]|nr:hypothetical protein [Candidatus Micrarchaeota archaeon]
VNYSVGSSSVVSVYGPYIAYVDLLPPTIQVIWPLDGETYTEGYRNIVIRAEDNMVDSITCTYNITGPNRYDNTIQIQNGTTYTAQIFLSEGSYAMELLCSDQENDVEMIIRFNIRDSRNDRSQPISDDTNQSQSNQTSSDQQNNLNNNQRSENSNQNQSDQTTVSRDINKTTLSRDIKHDISSSLVDSSRDANSDERKEIILVPDPTISSEDLTSNTENYLPQEEIIESPTSKAQQDQGIRGIVNTILYNPGVWIWSTFGFIVLLIFGLLRVVRIHALRNSDGGYRLLASNLLGKPVRGLKLRIEDRTYTTDESGGCIIELPDIRNLKVEGFWIVIREDY